MNEIEEQMMFMNREEMKALATEKYLQFRIGEETYGVWSQYDQAAINNGVPSRDLKLAYEQAAFDAGYTPWKKERPC